MIDQDYIPNQRLKTHDRMFESLRNALGYEKGMYIPYPLFSKVMSLSKVYGCDVVRDTIDEQYDVIRKTDGCGRFRSEYDRGRYVAKIIENHINDVYLRYRAYKRTEDRGNGPEATGGMDVVRKTAPHKDISRWID